MKNILFLKLIVLFLSFNFCYSQNQINLDVDNDLYFDSRDMYYSSGIFVSFSSLKNTDDKIFFNHFKIGQLIYTPSSRYEINPNLYDYPYSGYLFLELSKQKQISENSSFTFGGNIGITGDASLAKGMQNLYHDLVLDLPHLAWNSQMPQEFQINLVANYFKGFKIEDNVNITTKLYSKIGTYQIMTGVNFGLLIGDINWTGFSDNLINNSKNKLSFYLGTHQEYYFHDYKLEGSLFNEDAPLTMTSNKYRNTIEVGLKKKFRNLQILTTFNSMSKDTEKQRTSRHPFLKISLSYELN
ncbi:MAG: lipid A-modifier LpxR family protein [Candidatus Marisimplicoccus sp.]